MSAIDEEQPPPSSPAPVDEDAYTVYKRTAAEGTSLRVAGELTEVRGVEWIPEGSKVKNSCDALFLTFLQATTGFYCKFRLILCANTTYCSS